MYEFSVHEAGFGGPPQRERRSLRFLKSRRNFGRACFRKAPVTVGTFGTDVALWMYLWPL